MERKPSSQFEETAARTQDSGLLREFWQFVRENKKWWLIPIVVVTVVLGVLTLLAKTGAAPFIYTLF